jgi:hypothetical protein
MAGHFDPEKFDDRYEDARRDLIKRKAAGEKIAPAEHPKPKATTNLMDALRASLKGTQKRPPAASVHRRSAGGGRKPAARHKVRARRRGDAVQWRPRRQQSSTHVLSILMTLAVAGFEWAFFGDWLNHRRPAFEQLRQPCDVDGDAVLRP